MTTTAADEGRTEPEHGPGAAAGWSAVAAWALLIAGAFAVGEALRRAGAETEDGLPPLHAEPRLLTWQMAFPALVAAAVVAGLPVLARRLPWRLLLPAGWAVAAAWAVALAVTDGFDALAGPLNAPTEYPANLAAVREDPLGWLETFTERLAGYTTHVRGHPPLPMLVLWLLEAAGFPGTGWAAALIIAVGSSGVAAIAITVRCLAGEEAARRALPFLALAPSAVWIATSMDALFLGAGAWGTALVTIAVRRGDPPVAFLGGVLLGALPYLSYGLLPLFAVPLAVLVVVRPGRAVIVAALCGAAAVPALFTAGGFWWPDGVAATLDTYLVSRGSAQRSYAYFLVADFAVLGLLVGPVTAYHVPSAAGRLWRSARERTVRPAATVALLAGAGFLGTLALALAGVTRGEVERIWLPYAAWIVLAAALGRTPGRGALAAQAATALAVQALVLSPW